MTTANKITLFRVILIPVFLILLYTGAKWAALAVYIVACISDTVDGYIARHYNQVTDFGKFMDPLADKILVLSAMCWFIEVGQMPGWLVEIVLFREFAVSGLRLIAVERGRVIAAAWSGKIKTTVTMVGIIAMLAFSDYQTLDAVCELLILLTTVWSGAEYFWKNRDVFSA
jgi:CDP-diacylglycerol--glycerol-3-phosphate 3-phosphatidyltransferase